MGLVQYRVKSGLTLIIMDWRYPISFTRDKFGTREKFGSDLTSPMKWRVISNVGKYRADSRRKPLPINSGSGHFRRSRCQGRRNTRQKSLTGGAPQTSLLFKQHRRKISG